MKKKLAVILLAAVVAVTMMAPLQVFAENTAGMSGQNAQQASQQKNAAEDDAAQSSTEQAEQSVKKYNITIKAVNSAGHALKGAEFRVEDQSGRIQDTASSLRLAAGSYRVTENKAPAGYRAAAPQKFRVSTSGSVLVKGRTQQGRTVTLVNRRASGRHAAQHKAGTSAKAVKSGKTRAGKTTAVKRAAAEGENDAESADVSDSDGSDTAEEKTETDSLVNDAAVQPLAENPITNVNAGKDKSSYITSISVDKTEVTTPEQIRVTASFSDGGGNEHVFHGGDTITINWPKSNDAYIQGYSKTIPLVSGDGVTYASADITSDQAVITFNHNVDNMYDVRGDIWFTAVAVNNAAGDAENISSVTIRGGNAAQIVNVTKPKASSGSGGKSILPFFRKQAGNIGGAWQNVDGKYVMGLDPNNPTYTKWRLTANETHETGFQLPIIINDALGAGQKIDHNGDAQIYCERGYTDSRNITLSGSLDDVVKQWNDKYGAGGSSLRVDDGSIVWTITSDIADGTGWHLDYSCLITDYSLPLLQNEAELTYTDQNGERKTMQDASYFANVNAGGDITALPRGVLQITKKVKGTDQTVPGVTFTVEKQNGQSWTEVEMMTTNADGKATMSNLKAGEYRVYESGHPDYLNGDFTVDAETYSKDNPYTFTVNENNKNGIAVTAEDSIKTNDITATKIWKKADGTDDTSDHPAIWFQLYRTNSERKTTAIENSIKELKNGTTSVTWNNMPQYDVQGNAYTYSVKEVDQNGNDYTPDGYEKTENGLTVTNKKSMPWTPLKPAKTVIPWTPLTPAKAVIPWTPLTPSKTVVPLTPLAPAKTVIPWTPLTPSTPVKPDTPVTPVTPTIQKTSVKVTKNWVGGQGTSAVVHLLADGKVVNTAELNAQNNWTYTFTDLDKQSAGHDIQYTVAEDKLDGYSASVTGDAQNGFVITNTKDQSETPVTPVKPDKPDTPVTPTPSKPDHYSGNNTPSHPENNGGKGGQNTPVKPSSPKVNNHQNVNPMTPAAAKTAVSGNHAAESANTPKTGDSTALSLYAFLFGGAAALLAVVLALRSRKED